MVVVWFGCGVVAPQPACAVLAGDVALQLLVQLRYLVADGVWVAGAILPTNITN